MSKFKYGDSVIIMKDPENDGFFIGVSGVLQDKDEVQGEIRYLVQFGHPRGGLWCKEDEIQKI